MTKQVFCNKYFFRKIFLVIIIFLFSLMSLFYCKQSDKHAYEEVLSTLSLQKAKQFFENYPESPYIDQLITRIMALCAKEDTKQCCSMVIEVIPLKHGRREEFKKLCEKQSMKKRSVKDTEI
jgi:hypothetical protein